MKDIKFRIDKDYEYSDAAKILAVMGTIIAFEFYIPLAAWEPLKYAVDNWFKPEAD